MEKDSERNPGRMTELTSLTAHFIGDTRILEQSSVIVLQVTVSVTGNKKETGERGISLALD